MMFKNENCHEPLKMATQIWKILENHQLCTAKFNVCNEKQKIKAHKGENGNNAWREK